MPSMPAPGAARRLVRLILILAALPAAAAAQPLPAGCERGELATLPLTLAETGVPVVEARINGEAVRAEIDTGQQHATHLDRQTVERLGIKVQTADTNYARVQIQNALIDRLALGPMEVTKGWFNVDELQRVGVRVGANLLFRHDVEIALAGGYLRFFKPSGCFRAHLAYWEPKAVVLPFQNDPQRRDRRPWFKVRINGKDIDAVISTLDYHSYIDLYTARRLGLDPDAPGAMEEQSVKSWYDRVQRVWRVPVPQMSIGSLQVNDFNLRLFNMDRSGEMLVLGLDFLKRHRVYVAMSQNRIYFTPVEAPAVGSGMQAALP